VVFGLILAAVLVLAGVLTALRQRRALRALAEEPFVPPEDLAFRRKTARRRTVTSGLLLLIGALIAAYYLSGMDARMDAIAERPKGADGAPVPPTEEEKEFAKTVGFYWIGVMALVFAVMCAAVVDFYATRKYWMARYKEMKTDHDTKLQRDLAVFRQQKLNKRVPGLPPPAPDDTGTGPPVVPG
jgi:hypothetical protein